MRNREMEAVRGTVKVAVSVDEGSEEDRYGAMA
jgi:hypothetical protein